MVFLKHRENKVKEKEEPHHFALVCPGCSVIRDFEIAKHGPLDNILSELKISELIKNECVLCERKS
jgi:hypothetical protein